MKGRYEIKVQNRRIRYKFSVERNITILRGDSATGKTTLIDMIAAYERNGAASGVSVSCSKRCVVIDERNWAEELKKVSDSIVFIDEGDPFIKSKEFAAAIRNTDNYYVIATRASLFALPYSIKEVYGIKNKAGNRYQGTKRLYSEFYPLYEKTVASEKIVYPDCIVVEDSNSGFDFFEHLAKQHRIPCISAKGKSNIFRILRERDEKRILVVADGAAFGPELERILELRRTKEIIIYLPESFEWMILKSGLVEGVSTILEEPHNYIESKDYYSWERYFTNLLTEKTSGGYRAYQKSHLNPVYNQNMEKQAILEVMPGIQWKEDKDA